MAIIRRPAASAILFWEIHRGNWSTDLRIGTSRLFPANLAESEFGAPGCAHLETQRRAEHEILAAPNSVGQASRLSLTLDEQLWMSGFERWTRNFKKKVKYFNMETGATPVLPPAAVGQPQPLA